MLWLHINTVKTVSNVLNQFADEAKALEEFYSNELLVSFSKALFDHHEGTMNLTLHKIKQ